MRRTAGLGVNVFDGKKLERVDGVPHLRDVFATDTHAYIYTGSAVYRSADAHTWELVTMNTPSGAASLAVHDGRLYFGTYNEEIIISDLAVDDMIAGPRISALDGNGLVSGVQSDITIAGTGFDQGATVTISGTTPIEYVNTDVSTDGTTIVATVIPGEINQKQYYLTLTVTNPDGQRVTSGTLWIDVAPVDDGGKVWNPNKPVN